MMLYVITTWKLWKTNENKKSELMFMRHTRAYSNSCLQLISVYLHPFCSKFHCHGNQGGLGQNFVRGIRWPNSESPPIQGDSGSERILQNG